MLNISNIDFKKLQNEGKNKIGMVINLDEHYKSGSHWVALYTDLKSKQVYYFDSFGKKPGKRVKRFINKITNHIYKNTTGSNINVGNILSKAETNKKYLHDLNNKLKENNIDLRYNKIQHQFDNTECGVYSTNFILRLAKGESFDSITENITNDEKMNECREVYFNKIK